MFDNIVALILPTNVLILSLSVIYLLQIQGLGVDAPM